jgi:predicted RNase H-like nuclease (RuvC/YqgF family)
VNQVFVAVLALVGVAVTAFGGYIIAKHQRSGKIDTTDADTLWQEGKDLREFLKDRIRALEAEVKDLKFEVRELKLEIAGLRAELRKQGTP